jgi:hypothetical protein
MAVYKFTPADFLAFSMFLPLEKVAYNYRL